MIDPQLEAAAAIIARLPADEQEKALAQLKTLVVLGTGDDRVELKAPIRTLGEYLDAEPEDAPRIVEPAVIVRGGITVMHARAGFGKTSVNLHRILRWAIGRPMFDEAPDLYRPADGPVRTLIIENEGAGAEFHNKVGVMLAHSNFSPEEREQARENVLVWGTGGFSDLRIDDPEGLRLIRSGIDEHKPDVVFLEPFSHLHGANENDNSEMRNITTTLQQLTAQYGIGILLAHHDRKSGAGEDDPMTAFRGAGISEGAMSYMEQFTKVRGADQRELTVTKRRYMKPEGYPQRDDPVRMQWREDGSGWYDYIAPEMSADEVLGLLSAETPQTAGDLALELEESEQRIRRILRTLEDAGRARKRPGREYGAQGSVWFLTGAPTETKGGMSF